MPRCRCVLVLLSLSCACGCNETTTAPPAAPMTVNVPPPTVSVSDAGVSDDVANQLAAQAENLPPLGALGGGVARSGDSSALGAGALDAGVESDRSAKPKGPVGLIQMGGGTSSTPMPDFARVIAGLRPRLRQCYQQGLNSDPSMTCKVTMTIKIASNGEVASADINSNVGASPVVAACFKGAFRRAQFAGPGNDVTAQTRFECLREQ